MKILITGATSGIGKQLAIDYCLDGYEVWAVGRNQKVLTELGNKGIFTVTLDLTDRRSVLGWFESFEGVDLAILNAGTCEYIDLPHFDSELVKRVMRTNVESVANTLEAVLPHLRKSTDGHLAVVGSSAAFLPLPRAEAYGGSKAAIHYMVESLRLDLHKENISVSLICPGFVQTPLTARNDFPMPLRISVSKASEYIRKGLAKKQAEIHFPKLFTYTLKFLSFLPRTVWFWIGKRMVRS